MKGLVTALFSIEGMKFHDLVGKTKNFATLLKLSQQLKKN
jgi:hypothetical protein